MPKFNRVVLTKALVSRKLNGSGDKTVHCENEYCNRELKPGDTVFSHMRKSARLHSETDYYCLECYEGLWI